MNPSVSFGSLSAAGTSNVVWRPRNKDITVFVTATGVTTGAKVQLSAALPAGSFCVIAEQTITQNGTTFFQAHGAFSKLRVALVNYTDGSYDIGAEAA